MKNFLQPLKSKRGQTLVEYALLLVLIALVVIGAVRALGVKTNSVYTTIESSLNP